VYGNYNERIKRVAQDKLEKSLIEKKRKQPGIAFPSATKQRHLLLIRFNISHSLSEPKDRALVRTGVNQLCGLLERIDKGKIRIDDLTENGDIRTLPLSEFNFSATLGFGIGFFEKLKIAQKSRPKKLKGMPNHVELGDPTPYSLKQTDFMIQLGSSNEDVNRWVYRHFTARTDFSQEKTNARPSHLRQKEVSSENDRDGEIYSTISDWASVTDIHAGFQRIDGRNLLGFNDGISNPRRLSNDIVWITSEDEDKMYTDGTYMVFQKIEHDLELWCRMNIEKQEEWVGRSKGTGLLLGTLPKELDRKLALDMHSENLVVREQAIRKWKKLYQEQKDPDTKFFEAKQSRYKEIQLECPVWSHVRKSNPRQADGAARALIFRRGYLYSEGSLSGAFSSGLLFICFQRDIEKGFEYIKEKFLNNKDFPVPEQRIRFTPQELTRKQHKMRLAESELKKGTDRQYAYASHVNIVQKPYFSPDTQTTGKEGFSGPSELGVFPRGQLSITLTLGGGYYFIPPIPNKRISEIGKQFFI
jgi:Dyp-type peroxidase family